MAGLITNSNALICTELEFKVSEINVTSAFYHSQWITFLTNINKRKSFLLLPEEGAVPEKLGGGAGPLHKTLTLVMTKICHFCFPIYDHTKKIRYFTTIAAGKIALNLSYEGRFLIVLSIIMKK